VDNLYKINKYLFEELFIVPIIILVASFNSFPLLKNLYVFFPLLGMVLLFAKRAELLKLLANRKLVLVLYCFPLWAAITSFWSLDPQNSLIRAGYFAFVLTVAFVAGTLWFRKKENLDLLIPINIFVVLVSVISLIFGVPESSWELSPIWRFKGFAQHQNTLGALILFTSLPLIWNLFLKKINIFQLLLLLINVGVLIITFSRASILSFVLIFVVLTIRLKFTLFLKILGAVVVLISILLLIKPQLVIKPINHIVYKGSYSAYSTREKLFDDSFQSAINGGLLGLGYGVSNPQIKNPINVGGSNSIREKGNSTLALIEETGIIGLVLFLLPLLTLANYFFRFRKHYSVSSYELSVISNPSLVTNYRSRVLLFTFTLSLLLHSQFEAWLGGVSSFQLLIYFVLLGSLSNDFYSSKFVVLSS